MKIQGRVAIVTGGASGLGEACVKALLEAGAKVGILDLAAATEQAISSAWGNAAALCTTDVTNEKSVKDAIDKISALFGEIHFVINCAGVATPGKILGKKGPLSIDEFAKVVQINLFGTVNVIRLACERMIQNAEDTDGEKGVIVNTASIAAFEGQIGQAAYAASKAGVVGLTLPLARELAAHGIRVVAIAPGLFETPMTRSMPQAVRTSLLESVPFPHRFGRPEEFARLVLHILENPFLNGTTVRLDAAMRMGAR